MTTERRKVAAALLSVCSNTGLVLVKLGVGFKIGSVSVISEAIHSGADLLAALIALVAVRESNKPADEKHPFGHGKFENISGTIEAILIFAAAGWIIYEAVDRIRYPHGGSFVASWGVLVMLLSAAVNWVVSGHLMKVGREADSVALEADAWHLRTDVYTSVGVMFGLGLIWLGDWLLPQLGDALHVIDPLAAIIVALLIIRAAWHLTVKSARDLMDIVLPREELDWITQMLSQFRPDVHGWHRLRTRKAGAYRFVDFHVFVDAQMTVEDSHRLAHEIGTQIEQHFGRCSVTVHVEPCSRRCESCGRAGCLLTEEERRALRREGEEEAS